MRLRGPVMQVVVSVVGRGWDVERRSRRRGSTGRILRCTAKAAMKRAVLAELEAAGWEVVRWRRRNLYFGGAAAVEQLPDGEPRAAATRAEAEQAGGRWLRSAEPTRPTRSSWSS